MKIFRLYHLLFGAGALVAYFTAEELGLVHAWVGYGIAALLILRAALGFASAQGFRFNRLLPRLRTGATAKGLRHPAIGNALSLALVLCVAGTAGTGIAMDRGGTLVGKSIRADDEENEREEHGEEHEEASLFPALPALIPPALADVGGEGGEDEEGPLAEIHETLGNVMLPLAVLHALYLLIFRFQMARFMLFLNPRRAKA